jgi:hypothetical protein
MSDNEGSLDLKTGKTELFKEWSFPLRIKAKKFGQK